ncbi:hypothetical protein BB559_004098 [Furculomyces boomerangus]|uniref:RING-type E3 ubiquitin transferase n=1 Tax=Furculomyces boomerangus TaxID=61424 RepID=A0A2T9YGN4_9FUNG|nr:hypothetical protein BB559_004098 [Furculomyces boomerangus]
MNNNSFNISKKLNLLFVILFVGSSNSGTYLGVFVALFFISLIFSFIRYNRRSKASISVKKPNNTTPAEAVVVNYPTTANESGYPNDTYPPQQDFVGYNHLGINGAAGSPMFTPPLLRNVLETYTKVRLTEALQIIPPNLVPRLDVSNDSIECLICFKKIPKSQYTRIIPCNHLFHISCIDRHLLRQNGNCPLCSYNLNTDFITQPPPQFPDSHLNHSINVQ